MIIVDGKDQGHVSMNCGENKRKNDRTRTFDIEQFRHGVAFLGRTGFFVEGSLPRSCDARGDIVLTDSR